MLNLKKVLAITKITRSNQITLAKDVREKLKVKEGDEVLFREDDNGNIIIEPNKEGK